MRLFEAIQLALMVFPHPKLMDKPLPVPSGITAAGGHGERLSCLHMEECICELLLNLLVFLS